MDMQRASPDSRETQILAPFLKWPGGKRWFVNQHIAHIPRNFERYIEPFLGSGSVFFALQPERALLSDANKELIDAFRAMKSRRLQVVSKLQEHADNHSDAYYYVVRESEPSSLVERAARMLYLNRTCFNGIYRVNLNGKFNVPRGSKDAVFLGADNFEAIARSLHRAELCCSDFESIIDQAGVGDLVFADPPYTVRHNNNGFIKYNENLFSWSDQERLAAALARACRRGAVVVATNANHSSIRELYGKYDFSQKLVSRYSSIGPTARTRRQYEELILTGVAP